MPFIENGITGAMRPPVHLDLSNQYIPVLEQETEHTQDRQVVECYSVSAQSC